MEHRSSFSQHNTFSKCARWWFYEKIRKIEVPQDLTYANAGKVLHECLEEYYSTKSDISAIKEFFNKRWLHYKLDKSILQMKSDAYWLMVVEGVNKNVSLSTVEMEIFYPEIIGYLDGINTSTDEIIDWKSSTRTPENEEEYTRQMHLYAYLYRRKFGRTPKKITVYYLKYTGSKSEFIIEPTMDDIIKSEDWYFSILKKMIAIKESDKAPDKCEQCDQYCPYKDMCSGDKEGVFSATLEIIGNYIWVNAVIPPLLHKGLDKKFSYTLKDIFFMQKHNPNYDGVIHFYNMHKQLLPIGFMKELLVTLNHYCEHKKLTMDLKIVDRRKFNQDKVAMPDKFINGKELRPYQNEAIEKYLQNPISLLQMGTGSGKTETTIEIIRRLGVKTLFIVDKIELLNQTKKRIEDCLGIKVGAIGAGENDIQDITVGTIQTLVKHADELRQYLSEIRFAVFDECHKVSSLSYQKISKYLVNTEFRIGLCLDKRTQITIEKGHKKSIDNIQIGDIILSYNEQTKQIENDIVKNIFKKEIEEGYIIYIKKYNGQIKKIRCSGEHRFFMNRKYIMAKNLNIGDNLFIASNLHCIYDNASKKEDIKIKISNGLKGKKHWWKNPCAWKKGQKAWNKGLTKEIYPNIASHRKGKTIEEEYGIVKAKEIRVKNSLGHKGIKKSKEAIEKQRRTVKERGSLAGSNNPMYTTGLGYITKKLKREIKKCQICGIPSYKLGYKKFHLHHKTKDRTKNDINDVMVLCAKCHMQEHIKLGDRKGNLPEKVKMMKTKQRVCEKCGKEEKLVAFFIDKNKNNIKRKNIKLLCVMCHRKINYKNQNVIK